MLKNLFTKGVIAALMFASGAALTTPCEASPLVWTISGTFANNSVLTGTLTYDPAAGAPSDWNLLGAFNFDYTPANSTFIAGQCCTDQFEFIFTTSANILTLSFAFNPDLTSAGGTSSLAGGDETFSTSPINTNTINLVSGRAVSVATARTPEPATGLLCVGAFCLLPIRRRMKRSLN
ncbi:MAG TPA: hypothetical protein VHB50_09780 [Bryobacteraceae bacterium]|nr:hypothetical protein [Bryobacteraceae bacterium]